MKERVSSGRPGGSSIYGTLSAPRNQGREILAKDLAFLELDTFLQRNRVWFQVATSSPEIWVSAPTYLAMPTGMSNPSKAASRSLRGQPSRTRPQTSGWKFDELHRTHSLGIPANHEPTPRTTRIHVSTGSTEVPGALVRPSRTRTEAAPPTRVKSWIPIRDTVSVPRA